MKRKLLYVAILVLATGASRNYSITIPLKKANEWTIAERQAMVDAKCKLLTTLNTATNPPIIRRKYTTIYTTKVLFLTGAEIKALRDAIDQYQKNKRFLPTRFQFPTARAKNLFGTKVDEVGTIVGGADSIEKAGFTLKRDTWKDLTNTFFDHARILIQWFSENPITIQSLSAEVMIDE